MAKCVIEFKSKFVAKCVIEFKSKFVAERVIEFKPKFVAERIIEFEFEFQLKFEANYDTIKFEFETVDKLDVG